MGCGTAAGIAASFNTPLAGVIFALEVVMMEYTLASFIPVILAAASATLVSVAAFGNIPAFEIQPMTLGDLADVPIIVLLGLLAGALSTLMIVLVRKITGLVRDMEMWKRMLLAGLAMIPFAILVPETMGIGYDTVNQLLAGHMLLLTALLLVFGKLLATSAVIGLGVPGGIIGPSLFIGAALGALCEALATALGVDVPAGLLPLLGMGAMMGAALQAPLAALTAIMELTHSPGIIMPGMLVIVIASLTASEVFRQESLFITMMKASGLDFDQNPVLQALRRVGVAAAMSTEFSRARNLVSVDEAETLLVNKPLWLIVEEDGQPVTLMRAADLANYLEAEAQEHTDSNKEIDLMAIPAQRYDVSSVSIRENLQEARDLLENSAAEALYVASDSSTGIARIYGILTSEMIESSYRK